MILLAVLLSLSQDDADRRAHELVERLRSDKIDEREEAARALRAMGRPAFAAVEKALRDPDAEVAARAAQIFPILKLAHRLSPRLIRDLPRELERVAEGKPYAWTEAFVEATSEPEGKRRHPGLTTEDLLALARPALAEVGNPFGEGDLCLAIGRAGLGELKPELVRFLESDNALTRRGAREALVCLGAPEVVPSLLRSVRYGGGEREASILALARMRVKETAPDLIRVSFEAEVGEPVVAALLEMGERDALLSRARTLVKDPPPQAAGLVPVRPRAAILVGRLGDATDVILLEAAARDADDSLAQSARQALAGLKARLERSN